MTHLYSTPALRHLRQRRRLAAASDLCTAIDPAAVEFLGRLAQSGGPVEASGLMAEQRSALINTGLASATPGPAGQIRLPFAFVQAVNLELTYGCNLACNHCLQEPLRPGSHEGWLSLAAIVPLLRQAQALGLLTRGLNVTGGETFRPGSPLLEVLQAAKDLGIPTRANTNAWWGQASVIQIGNHQFGSDREVVDELQQRGLTRLALSLDQRYEQYPALMERVVQVCCLCESNELDYELVCTGSEPGLLEWLIKTLEQLVCRKPQHLRITPMAMVDVGAATPEERRPLRSQTLAALARTADCKGHGFDRPYYLHINPDGGVRSCLYAPGADWLGNIQHTSLVQILNTAATNPVAQLFASGSLETFVKTKVEPWAYLYRQPVHGCSAAALIARVAERLGAINGAAPMPDGSKADELMQKMHEDLAQAMGLALEPSVCQDCMD